MECGLVVRLQRASCRSHLDILLHAELGQGLLDAQGRKSGGSIGVPALPHDFPHHTQGLRGEKNKSKSINNTEVKQFGLTNKRVIRPLAGCRLNEYLDSKMEVIRTM